MTLLTYSGCEGGAINTWSTAAQISEDLGTGISQGGSAPTASTTTPRSGDYCWRAAANAQTQIRLNKGRVDGRHYFVGVAFRFSTSFPSALLTVLTNQFVLIRVTTGGVMQMESPAATIVGSTQQLTLGQWYYVELQSMIRAAAAEEIRWWLDGVEMGSSTAEGTTTLSSNFDIGPAIAYGASREIDIDDIYMTDDQGTAPFNTRLGPISVWTSLPISDVGGGAASWTKGDGTTTTNKFSAIDNRPPIGEATTSATVESQLENAASTTTDNQQFNFESLNTAGVPANHDVLATRLVAQTSGSSLTGTTDGSLEIISGNGHPAVAEATQDWIPTAVGAAYATGWHMRVHPAAGPTLQPTIVDRSVSPVVEIGKRIASTRVLAICQLRLDILSEAAVVSSLPDVTTPPPQRPILRR